MGINFDFGPCGHGTLIDRDDALNCTQCWPMYEDEDTSFSLFPSLYASQEIVLYLLPMCQTMMMQIF